VGRARDALENNALAPIAVEVSTQPELALWFAAVAAPLGSGRELALIG